MIEGNLEAIVSEVVLQFLADARRRHEDHRLAVRKHWEPKQLGDFMVTGPRRRAPSDQRNVGTVNAADEHYCVLDAEGREDSLPHSLSRSGDEGKYRWRTEAGVDLAQASIFGPEVSAPLIDAMGFVDDKILGTAAHQCVAFSLPFHEKALGSDVKELHRVLGNQGIADLLFPRAECAVDEGWRVSSFSRVRRPGRS